MKYESALESRNTPPRIRSMSSMEILAGAVAVAAEEGEKEEEGGGEGEGGF